VSLGVNRGRGRAYVRVADNGIGLPPDECEHVFDRFEGTNGSGNGVGSGLWLVRSIARAHGGDVEVHGSPGHGTTFTLSLPYDGGSLPPPAAK
jgi:signal transduction histidine kinase